MTASPKLACRQTYAPIEECQRQCLLHVLRNFATALNGAIYLVEDRSKNVRLKELLTCIKNLPTGLTRVINNLESDSFCPLSARECEFVGKFVGCNRITPRSKKSIKSSLSIGRPQKLYSHQK